MSAQLKVIHLIRRLERIQRDLEELASLQSGLKEDREYTVRILDPLIDEATRLKKLRKRIMGQTILNPPENLTASSSASSQNDPVVTAPGSKNKPAKPAEPEKMQENRQQPKTAAKKSASKKAANPYKFIFDEQN